MGRTHIFKNYMPVSLTVRQQAFGQAKRENDEINRCGRLGNTIHGPPTTVCTATASRRRAIAVTVVGGPRTRRR